MFQIFTYVFANSFKIKGRACRKECISCFLFGSLIVSSLFVLGLLFLQNKENTQIVTIAQFLINFSTLYGIILIPTCFSLSIRRLHDLNKSGWFLLLFILGSVIPFIGLIFEIWLIILLYFIKGSDEPNKYGEISPMYQLKTMVNK